MARNEIISCDRCGKQNSEAQAISVYIDRCMNGAGSMEDEYRVVDLCPSCMRNMLERFLNGKENVSGNHVYGQQWVDLAMRFK